MAFNPSGFFGGVRRAAGNIGSRVKKRVTDRVKSGAKNFKKNITSFPSNVSGAFTGGAPKKKKRKVSAQTLSEAQGFRMTPEANTGTNFAQAGGQERTATPYTGIRKRKKRPYYDRKTFYTPKRKRFGNGGNDSAIPESSLW